MPNDLSTVDINTLTAEILILRQQTVQNIIEIGNRLIKAKELLPHGEWGRWLEETVDFSQKTANRFMQVARECPNSSTLSNLPPSKVFALLELPPEQREAFVQENPVESMTTRELQKAIKEQETLQEQLTLAKAEAVDAGKDRDKLNTKLGRIQHQLELERKEAQATLNRMIEEAKEHQDKVTALTAELAKPVTVETAVVERIPEAVEQELAELRAKAAGKQKSDAVLKYQVQFDVLVSNFKALLVILSEIRTADPEAYETYRRATDGLIVKMQERL